MENAARMPEPLSSEELQSLRALVPLHTLPDDALEEVIARAQLASVHKGELLFREGEADHENVYLIKGRVALLNGKTVVERVDAGTDTARFPLAHQVPRKYTARAESKARIVRLDSRQLSDLLARSHTVDYQVDDFDEASDDDWMSMLLQSRVLQQVPASNIQRVMMSIEQVEVEKGEDLIRQGDPGDFYYMLTKGRAVVRRDNGDGNGAVELATLGPGDSFGEEALLSDNPRNSTVTMLHDGNVLRLSKEHFLQLINNPLIDQLDLEAAKKMVADGALWLDLQGSDDYDLSHMEGAINCPFDSLRYQTSSLAPDRHYVLYSSTGARAMAGAFLLAERGFDVSVLAGDWHDGDVSVVEALDSRDADTPVAEVPAVSTGSAASVDDAAMQQRIQEAEARAKHLEAQLKEVQQDQESTAAEREQHIDQVRQAIDQAKRKLTETEEQKREALARQQHAYSEMEQLTGNLEKLQSERTSLLDRISEIKGLDRHLQTRLEKAERELIGEKERAESATQNLTELSQKFDEELQRREEDRRQHALERGELKEELTALRMDLEQAHLDLEELRELNIQQADAVAASEVVHQQLREAQDAHQAVLAERDGLQQQQDELQAKLEESGKTTDSLDAQRKQADEALQASENELLALRDERDRLVPLQQQLDEMVAERDALKEQLSADQASKETALSALQAEFDQVRGELATSQAETERQSDDVGQQIDALRAELEQVCEELASSRAEAKTQAETAAEQLEAASTELAELREAHESLQNEAASGNAQAEGAITQAHQRVAELEAKITEAAEAATQQLSERQGELDNALVKVSELEAANERAEGDAKQQIEVLQSRLDEAQRSREALEIQLAELADASRTSDSEVEKEKQSLVSQIEALQTELDTAREQIASAAAEARSSGEAEKAYQSELNKLHSEHGSLTAELAQTRAAQADAEPLRAQLVELADKLEERDRSLQAAREEQAELIEALNSASAEREALQLAVSDREDEQARLVDLENQVAEALRAHQQELLSHEEQELALNDRLSDQEAARRALEEEVARLNELLESNDPEQGDSDAEVDDLKAELRQRESEVERLRSVIEEYVDQIRAAQSGDDDPSEMAALRAELEMVREQSIRDIAQMREQLATAEQQKRRLQQADGREAVSHESMRQKIDALESSLSERQREASQAEEAQQMLEDEIEDANRKLDELQQDLQQARQDAEDSAQLHREADKAREQLQKALRRIEDDAEDSRATDLRDERLAAHSSPIGIDSVVGGGGWKSGLIGAAVVLAAFEAISFAAGRGELLTFLFGIASQ